MLADIKQAFLNRAISSEHINYLRFLWFDVESGEMIVYKFLRVVYGLTSSPFLLNATIKHHLNKYIESDKIVVERLKDDMYVDDLVSGTDGLGEAKVLYEKSRSIMSEAGFDLKRKWETNSHELRAYISSQEGVTSDLEPGGDDMTYFEIMSPDVKTNNKIVLGLEWDTNRDEFVFRFKDLLSKCAVMERTKRNLLSVSASIFDPLGLIAPITARIKTISNCFVKIN
jgi:hypothetical protein